MVPFIDQASGKYGGVQMLLIPEGAGSVWVTLLPNDDQRGRIGTQTSEATGASFFVSG